MLSMGDRGQKTDLNEQIMYTNNTILFGKK